MFPKIADLLQKRSKAFDVFKAIAEKDGFNPDTDQAEYDVARKAITDVDSEITRAKAVQELSASTAQPVAGQAPVAAAVETDPYVKNKTLIIGGVSKMIGIGKNIYNARQAATDAYGENHPVTKALLASNGSAGGFIVSPDVMNEVIELLRPKARVRSAGPRNIPMPRGTMTLPSQSSSASASYGSESKVITKSQPSVGQIVASYKKLTALVPISNDMMRYANPAVDAFVRDDLIKVMALTEDRNFILSDGSQDTPRGYLSFANGWVARNGGTVGVWSRVANSVLAVNGVDPTDNTGGNFITSNPAYSLATVAQEIGGAINKLDTANVDDDKRVWFMTPRSKNYLYNVQNSLGVYVYRAEIEKGTLSGYPIYTTTQIGNSWWDAAGSNKDLSFVFLVEMTEDMILDSMQLELAVSSEGTYVDENGATVSAFAQDQTVIRAIQEHDHQLRHDSAVAIIQGVRWAPSLS